MEVKAESVGANCYQVYEWIAERWVPTEILHAEDETDAVSKYQISKVTTAPRFSE